MSFFFLTEYRIFLESSSPKRWFFDILITCVPQKRMKLMISFLFAFLWSSLSFFNFFSRVHVASPALLTPNPCRHTMRPARGIPWHDMTTQTPASAVGWLFQTGAAAPQVEGQPGTTEFVLLAHRESHSYDPAREQHEAILYNIVPGGRLPPWRCTDAHACLSPAG